MHSVTKDVIKKRIDLNTYDYVVMLGMSAEDTDVFYSKKNTRLIVKILTELIVFIVKKCQIQIKQCENN